jgi:hypothetical protein
MVADIVESAIPPQPGAPVVGSELPIEVLL